MNHKLATAVYYGALLSILSGFALLLAALGPERSRDWGETATECVTQTILIVGGLLAMAITSLSTGVQGDKE